MIMIGRHLAGGGEGQKQPSKQQPQQSWLQVMMWDDYYHDDDDFYHDVNDDYDEEN